WPPVQNPGCRIDPLDSLPPRPVPGWAPWLARPGLGSELWFARPLPLPNRERPRWQAPLPNEARLDATSTLFQPLTHQGSLADPTPAGLDCTKGQPHWSCEVSIDEDHAVVAMSRFIPRRRRRECKSR